ncbi:glycoside hydrolase family 13 protein [Trichococcus sp.]|uniref:glycoside hydrolase family 13 protein n=1 Tax=Trichococcus sp. TaxID=1985464 RepID=UPI003C7B6384
MTADKWWKKAVVYQIYPRSFQDSNGDGIGDIQGIISRLDYLEELGIDVIWLGPIYKSPMDDNGYDISDYTDISPDFGTVTDFDELLAEAGKRKIKIVMDLVVNHTSDEHNWFKEALKSKDNPYRDYYIWRDPVNGSEPNDLASTFGGSAWEYEPNSGQYYLHLYSKRQPDLNWENPTVRSEIWKMMNFWLAKGIGGFRMDVIDHIGKDPDKKIVQNGPKLHEYIQEMNRNTFGKYDVLTVGETWGATPEEGIKYSSPARNELSMIFQFEHILLDQQPDGAKWDLKALDLLELKKVLAKWQIEMKDEGWNSLFWNNHDTPRIVSRWGDDKTFRVESAKMFAILLHMMKGTPYIYQGEEIGMTNKILTSFDELNDIESINIAAALQHEGWQDEKIFQAINAKGRDNARTPMQWNADVHAGFSTVSPWLSVNPNKDRINVQEDTNKVESIFNCYKKLIEIRKNNPIIVAGEFKLLLEDDPLIFAYERNLADETWVVVANFSSVDQEVSVWDNSDVYTTILSNYGDRNYRLDDLKLRPYETFVIKKYSKDSK